MQSTVNAVLSPLWWPVSTVRSCSLNLGFVKDFVRFLMSHCGLYVAFRPRQTEAGLLLHRHLLSQQHLRVCVLLLPARVTVYSLALLPAKDQGNKVVFLAPSTRKKKKEKKKKNKSQLWLFPSCHTAASKAANPPSPFPCFRDRRDGDRLSRLLPKPRRHSLHV